MDTECAAQAHFSFRHDREICLDFEGGDITSDAGLVALREFDHRTGFTESLVAYLPRPVLHEQVGLKHLTLGTVHGVGFTGLKPQTQYEFKIQAGSRHGGTAESSVQTFTTSDKPNVPTSYHIAPSGDDGAGAYARSR